MPNHRIRNNPIGTPQRSQRQLQPHDHRLHLRITGNLNALLDHLTQRKTHLPGKNRLQLINSRSKHRLIGQQPTTHPHPMRTLTRKHKNRP